jgi:hypothetical protein
MITGNYVTQAGCCNPYENRFFNRLLLVFPGKPCQFIENSPILQPPA